MMAATAFAPGAALRISTAGVTFAPPPTAAAGPPAIVVAGASLWYGANQALYDITMDIPDKQVTAFIGPSGCGKSTLLRCFNRMNDLIDNVRVSGRILVQGRDINAAGTDVIDVRRRVGMVFQKSNPFPKSIFDNVAYGIRVNGLASGRTDLHGQVEESLRAAALWDEVKDRLDDPAIALSGGQQQRLCLARVLALEPEVIMLDEPSSGLDPISTAKVEASLQELKQQYTVIIVPSSVQQAGRLADWAGFFLQGELVEWASGRELFLAPRDRRTEDYLTGRFG